MNVPMRRAVPVELGDNEAAFAALYRSSMSTVLGFLYVRSGGDLDLSNDIAAETFTAAVGQFNIGRGSEVTVAWLCAVARRRLIDHWRRQGTASRKRPLVEQSTVVVADASDDALLERQAVAAALGRLNDDYRLALVLHLLDGYSIAEVADVLGRTEKATESLIGRAKEAFRRHYEGGHNDQL